MTMFAPFLIDGLATPAESVRRAVGAMFAPHDATTRRGGVTSSFELNVYLDGNQVMATPGTAVVPSLAGAYLAGASTVETVGTLGAPDSTYPRRDRVILEVLDPSNRGPAGERRAQIRIIEGEPGGSPSLPDPSLVNPPWIDLAEVFNPAEGVGGGPYVIDRRNHTAAAGGTYRVPDKDARDALNKYPNLRVFRDDIGVAQTWNGYNWEGDRQVSIEGAFTETPIDKYGVVTVRADSNGAAAWDFGEPFPNRILGATVEKVYQTTYGRASFEYDEGLSSRTRIAFRCFQADGTPLKAANPGEYLEGIRVSFHAWGE